MIDNSGRRPCVRPCGAALATEANIGVAASSRKAVRTLPLVQEPRIREPVQSRRLVDAPWSAPWWVSRLRSGQVKPLAYGIENQRGSACCR